MTTNILFLCPHNAAKSITAAALLDRESNRQSLDVEIHAAGTHPDADIVPIVRQRLEDEGLRIDGPPTRVTEAELRAADLVINIGCDVDDLRGVMSLTTWDIPDFSDGPDAAFAALVDHVASLAATLRSA